MGSSTTENGSGRSNSGNGKTQLLNALLSGDNSVKLITLCLIIATGGLNFFETKNGNELNENAINRASEEIHQLYPKLMQAIENQNQMMRTNSKQLDNQAQMLENQRHALDILKSGQDRFFNGGNNHP